MKFFKNIIVFLLIFSCSTIVDRNIEDAISHKWKYVGQITQACKQDDFIQLEKSGKYIYRTAINKCDFDEIDLEGNWIFNRNSYTLEIKYKNFRGIDTIENYRLETLTEYSLILRNDSTILEYKKI